MIDFDKLVDCVIWAESNYDPKAVSPVGAMGLMQLMPATAAEMAEELGLTTYDIFDSETNKKMGSRYLKKCLNWMNDDIRLALATYNYGIGNVWRLQENCGDSYESIEPALPDETRSYVTKIMGRYERT